VLALLVALTLLVLVTSIAVTSTIASRAEAVIAGSLVFNAILIVPIYALGLTGHLDRLTLGLSTVVECGALLAITARRNGLALLRQLPLRMLTLAFLPVIAIRRTWQKRLLVTAPAIVAAGMLPYMLVVSYLAPSWRDWDGLWYHEPLIGLTIQNHGFAPEPLPPALQVINGVHRLCEMTQLWFGIYGGRRVIEMANVFFMPLYAACVFVLVRRYTKEVTSGIAWAAAFVLLPGYLRLVQSTLVDPQACALLLAAAYYVTHPQLDRRNAFFAILATTLAAGAKIWSIVPVGLLSVFLLVRLLRRTRQNGGLATLGLLSFGSLAVLGMQAITYVRNLILFKNPVWPMISYHNPKLGIHWAGGLPIDFGKERAGVDFNEPFAVFCRKMLAAPYSVMSPGHYWQVNDYGFAWAWVVLPVFALAVFVIVVRWVSTFFAIRVLRVRSPGPADEALSSAMMLAVVASTSLYLSPAIFIARYHVASLGMLAGCLAWLVSRWKTPRLSDDTALFAAIGSIIFMYWAPTKHEFVYLYPPSQITAWLKMPYPQRELTDIGTPEVPKLLVAPVNTAVGTAREKELRAGDVIAFDYIDYFALLWNNSYSNKVMWVDSTTDPLGQAERGNAKWVYTRGGTTLFSQIHANPRWELIGPLEAESQGSVYQAQALRGAGARIIETCFRRSSRACSDTAAASGQRWSGCSSAVRAFSRGSTGTPSCGSSTS